MIAAASIRRHISHTGEVARPRDPDLDRRILASFRTLADRDGLAAATISAVAQHSGVSRPAIYRRWPNRAALAFEAQATLGIERGFADLGSLRAELIEAVHRLVQTLVTTDRSLASSMISKMITDPDFAAAIWVDRWRPDTEDMDVIWTRALERGEVNENVDGRSLMEDLVAMCLYRVGILHRPFSGADVEEFVDRLLHGVLRPS